MKSLCVRKSGVAALIYRSETTISHLLDFSELKRPVSPSLSRTSVRLHLQGCSEQGHEPLAKGSCLASKQMVKTYVPLHDS
jgi:hypothetical protein